MSRPARWLVYVGATGLAACATRLVEHDVAPERIAARWLPPIVVGQTALATVEQALGPATATFESGRARGWILVPVEPAARVERRDDGYCPGMASLGSGTVRSARRAELLRTGRCRVVAAADVVARALWPTVREAEFHLVVVARGDGCVDRWSLVRVLP